MGPPGKAASEEVSGMGKRRIEITGEGSIVEVERGRVYRIRHRIPPTEPGGKRRWSPSRTVRGTKGQARIALEEYRRELEEELNNENPGLTVGEYAREFQERRRESGTLSPLTVRRDEIETERIERLFGSLPIADLTTADINKAYAKLRKKKASPSSLHKLHAKLRQVLKQAVKEDIILQNPCDKIDDVRRPAAKERRSLSAEQAISLAIHLKGSVRNGKIVAVWLALATGMRRGEALGLDWSRVGLKKACIRIDRQLDSQGEIRPPKSKKSVRTVSIDEGTVSFLREWRSMQSKEFFEGGEVPDDCPVCTSEHGDYLEPNTFNRWRRAFFVEAGLGRSEHQETYVDKKGVKRYRNSGYVGFNFHELRHTQATLLIGSGADVKTVQHRLGHSTASLTMDIYAHALEKNDRDAADAVGNMLGL